jgi:hypothetical protein
MIVLAIAVRGSRFDNINTNRKNIPSLSVTEIEPSRMGLGVFALIELANQFDRVQGVIAA